MLNLNALGLQYRPLLTASLAQQAMAIMQKYNASAWLPFSGRNAEYNTSDALGSSLASIGGSVGFVADYVKEWAPENMVSNSRFVDFQAGEVQSTPGLSFISSNGVTAQLLRTGIDSYGEYCDTRFFGTPTAASFAQIRLVQNTLPITAGSLYTVEADVEILDCKIANYNLNLQILGFTAGGAFVESTNAGIILNTVGRQHYRAARVLSNATTARLSANIQNNGNAGVPVDITIRMWRPHLYSGFGAAYAATSGSAVLRAGYSSLVQETTGFKPVLTNDQSWTVDGVDDRLGTSTPTVTNPTGDCFRVAGWQTPAVATGTTQVIVAGTVGDAGVARSLEFFLSTGSINACVIHRDDLGATVTLSPVRAANERIIASIVRSGDSHETRFRGDINPISAATTVQAMTAWTPLYERLGCFRSGGTDALFFTGPIYGSIQGQGAPTPAEILILEDFLAAHAGITLV